MRCSVKSVKLYRLYGLYYGIGYFKCLMLNNENSDF